MSKSPGCGATSGESRVAVLTPVFDKDDRPSNSVEKRQVTEVSIFYREGTNLKIQEKRAILRINLMIITTRIFQNQNRKS